MRAVSRILSAMLVAAAILAAMLATVAVNSSAYSAEPAGVELSPTEVVGR